MTLLVFGKTGQVAQEMQRLMPNAIYLDRNMADLANPDACAAAIKAHAPDRVINAAAFTAVDRAEDETVLAKTINANAPGAMAQACARADIPFMHISTDYVFPGTEGAPWQPYDESHPQNNYGRSKLAGEIAVRAAGGVHVILRTSWVFSSFGNNFVKTMLRLGKTHKTLSVVCDQIGGPTPAADIAQACLHISEALQKDPSKTGTYHFSGAPDVSWKDFAGEIFAQSGQNIAVTGIATENYPTPASRPLNSRLDCTSTHSSFGLDRPKWKAGLAQVLSELE